MDKNTENNMPLRSNDSSQEFTKKGPPLSGEKIRFSGVNGQDVYNISAPFRIGDVTVIAGRVEAREAWADSHVVFFQEQGDAWAPVQDAPVLRLEDGLTAHIENDVVVGGVEVYTHEDKSKPQGIRYRTVFYKGQDLSSLQKFAVGPDLMKDIRLAPLANGKIGVCTRPQGGKYGKGKIGYIELDSLQDLNAKNLLNAKIIEGQFSPEEWGGANELHPLENGTIGVLGHIAYQDKKGAKHYYAMAFIYNPATHTSSPIKIIATRDNFPAGEHKMPDLADVIFPGGLIRHDNGTATLYAGLSDAEAGKITIPDPFI